MIKLNFIIIGLVLFIIIKLKIILLWVPIYANLKPILTMLPNNRFLN